MLSFSYINQTKKKKKRRKNVVRVAVYVHFLRYLTEHSLSLNVGL